MNSILHRNRVNILPKCGFLNYFPYLCSRKAAKLLPLGFAAWLVQEPQFWPPNIQLNYVFIMARPIKETPVLKGEDAFNFEMRRLEVENRTPEERAEARRKFQEQVAEASKHIQWCW